MVADLFIWVVEGLHEGSRGIRGRADCVRTTQPVHPQGGALIRGTAALVLPAERRL